VFDLRRARLVLTFLPSAAPPSSDPGAAQQMYGKDVILAGVDGNRYTAGYQKASPCRGL
jgi:hypothetical protein